MSKVMFSLPNKLVVRMKSVIPGGERSRMVAEFLEKVVTTREQALYESALALEKNSGLQSEMKVWDDTFSNDGLDNV